MAKKKNITITEMHGTELVDAGMTVGVVYEMLMGSEFTSLHIREEMNSKSLHHIILVKNELARRIRLGTNLCVKLEVFVDEKSKEQVL